MEISMAFFETRRVLKSDAVRNLGTRVVFNYDDLNSQCEEKIAEVRRQAEKLLRDAEREAEELRQQAHQLGYQAGYESGAAKVDLIANLKADKIAEELFNSRLQASLPIFETAAAQLNQKREQWLSQWESAAIRLAAAIASKVLHKAVRLRPDLCEINAREALKLAAGKTQVSVRMNPEDITALGDRVERFATALNWTDRIPVIPDPSIGRGGCIVQSEHGEIDARLESQIERIADELLN